MANINRNIPKGPAGSNMVPFSRTFSQRSIPPMGTRQAGNLALDRYHHTAPRADFVESAYSIETSILNNHRIGGYKPDLLAQLISNGHLPISTVLTELNASEHGKGPHLTPDEAARVITSDYMKTSDAAKLLSNDWSNESAPRIMASLYSLDPEKLAAVMLCRDMPKLRLAQMIDSAIKQEKAGGINYGEHSMSEIMVGMLRTYISPESAPEVLYYMDNGHVGEILSALDDRALAARIIRAAGDYDPGSGKSRDEASLEHHEAFFYDLSKMFGPTHKNPPEEKGARRFALLHLYSEEELNETGVKETLELVIRFVDDINTEQKIRNPKDEAYGRNAKDKLILMKNAALAVKLLDPDEAAEILGRRKARDIAEEILSTGHIPPKQKASILNSEKMDRDSASYIMAEMPLEPLVEMLECIDANTNPIIKYGRLVDLFKSRYFTTGKALALLKHPGFNRGAFIFARRDTTNDVLMNTVLYYMDREDARALIARSGRDEATLKDVLARMFVPSEKLDEPCAP